MRLTGGGCALALVLAVLILFGQVAWGHVTVFHSTDVMVVVIAGLLALEGALFGLVLVRRPDIATRVQRAPWTAQIRAGLFIILFAVSLPAGLVLWLNQSLDRSRGTSRTLTVREKSIRTYNGGSQAWLASVPADAPRHPPIVFPRSRDTEPVVLPCSGYAGIEPGQSLVTLTVHPGAFRLPWYDRASLTP